VEDERRKREQALIIAQVAKQEALIEAKKFDEALIALNAAKLMAKKESQMRKEAEDRANKEALDRQKALSALQQAEMRYRQYSFEELEAATDGFSELNQIGLGGYGPVYKGKLHHTMVAIKVLKKDSVQGPKEFQQEVKTRFLYVLC
jgi:transposase